MCILKIRDNFLRLFETDLASEIKFSLELKICESKGSFNDTLIIIRTGQSYTPLYKTAEAALRLDFSPSGVMSLVINALEF